MWMRWIPCRLGSVHRLLSPTVFLRTKSTGTKHPQTKHPQGFFGSRKIEHDPKDLAKVLKKIERQLEEAEKEECDRKQRGVQSIKTHLRKNAPSKNRRKRINNRVATDRLKMLIYVRHALLNGYKIIKEMMCPRRMARSLLGEETKQLINLRTGKIILVELWRYKRSPMLESYKKKDEDYWERRREIERNTERKKLRREQEALAILSSAEVGESKSRAGGSLEE